jgi:hypothetical protein
MSLSDSIIFSNDPYFVEPSGPTRNGGWNGAGRAPSVRMLQRADTTGRLESGGVTTVGVDSGKAR